VLRAPHNNGRCWMMDAGQQGFIRGKIFIHATATRR
jgi:hypothetical protein